jgi:predicted enzyme involved in methoxymalonyl-ACP biosynthesis
LNLGLDSFVYIDDNKFELNEVKSQLPLVETIGFDKPEELLNLPVMMYNEHFQEYF